MELIEENARDVIVIETERPFSIMRSQTQHPTNPNQIRQGVSLTNSEVEQMLRQLTSDQLN